VSVSGNRGDIVQRLPDHARELRAVVPTTASRPLVPPPGLIDYSLLDRPAPIETVVELTTAEREALTTADRLEELRGRLATIQRDLSHARRRAYDAVLSLDERLAKIDRAVKDVAAELHELD
jgi:hypothetical protein